MKRILLFIVLSLLFLSGCALTDGAKRPERINLDVICKEMGGVHRSQVKISDQEKIKSGKNKVIKVSGLAAYDVIQLCFGEILCVPYTVDTSIRTLEKSIDIDVADSITKRDFYEVVKKSLNMIGVEVVERSGVYYIRLWEKGEGALDLDDRHDIYIESLINQKSSDVVLLLQDIVKEIDEEIRLYPDDEKNIVIIVADAIDFEKVKKLILELDRPKKQVFIEIVIVESTETEDVKNGLMFYLQNTVDGFSSVFGLDLVGDAKAIQYSLVKDSGKFSLLLSYLNQIGFINMVSNPYLIVANNQSASLNIGMEVPILTTTEEDDEDALTTEVAYRKTGIVVKVNPVIIGNKIKLDVYIESSQAQVNNVSLISSPSILTRSITTDMLLDDNDALIIGGIKENVLNESSTGFPIENKALRSVLNYNESSGSKIEMLIMLRAFILEGTEQKVLISSYLKEKNHVD